MVLPPVDHEHNEFSARLWIVFQPPDRYLFARRTITIVVVILTTGGATGGAAAAHFWEFSGGRGETGGGEAERGRRKRQKDKVRERESFLFFSVALVVVGKTK